MQLNAETIIYGYFHFTKNDKLEFPKFRKIKEYIRKEDPSIYVNLESNSIYSCVELCKDLSIDGNQTIWFKDLGEGLNMENRFMTNLFNDCCDGDRNDIPIRNMIYNAVKSVEETYYKTYKESYNEIL